MSLTEIVWAFSFCYGDEENSHHACMNEYTIQIIVQKSSEIY